MFIHVCAKCVCAVARIVSHYYARVVARGWRKETFSPAITRFMALNNFTAQWLELAGVARAHIRVCSNFATMSEGVGSPKEPFALFCGRLSNEKGLWTLLEVVANLPDSFRLIIAGNGPLETKLRRHVEPKLQTKLAFVGYVAGAEKFDLLRRVAYVVVPSEWYENCPISVLEALACGTAVIASYIGGLPELVQDGKTGSLFAPRSINQLSAAMLRYTDQPAMAAEHGAAAKRFAREHFSGETHYRKLKAAYEDACVCTA